MIFLGQDVIPIVNTHEESELCVTQMIVLPPELEVNGMGFIPNITTLKPLKSGEELKC